MLRISECENSDEFLNNSLRMLKLMVPKIIIKEIYYLIDDNQLKYLVHGDAGYFIINLVDNNFDSVDIFNIDDNNHINYLRFHGTNIILDDGVVYTYNNDVLSDVNERESDEDYIYNYSGCVENSITITSIPVVDTGYVTYNALINYLAYDFKGTKSLFCRYLYDAKFDGDDRITESYCKLPFHINIVSLRTEDINKEDEEFFLTQWNKSHKYYGLALMKLVTLMAFVDGEIYDSFEYYYNKPLFDEEGRLSIWNLLRSKVYDEEDIKKLIKKRGFDLKIPQELIDLYNGDNDNYQYALKVKKALDDYLIEKNSKKLVNKYGGVIWK